VQRTILFSKVLVEDKEAEQYNFQGKKSARMLLEVQFVHPSLPWIPSFLKK